MNLYQNKILAILIIDQHSVHFGLFSLVRSTLVHVGPIQSNLVYLGPIRFTLTTFNLFSPFSSLAYLVQFSQSPFSPRRSISVQFVPYSPLRSNSVHFSPYYPFQSTSVNLVHSVHFGILGPIQSIRSNSVYCIQFGPFCPFGLFQFTLVHLEYLLKNGNKLFLFTSVQFGVLLKNGQRQVWVKSTINCLSNINCNYMIIFGYHNNFLK